MKTNISLKRTFIIVMAAALLVAAMVGFNRKNVMAAGERVISDWRATAHINSDGSGYLTLNYDITKDNPLDEIDGVPLKEIIKMNNGAYVEKIYKHNPKDRTPLTSYNNEIVVYGGGPSGLFSALYMHFYDKTNDQYNLSIWRSSYDMHTVNYNSDDPQIVYISWNN